MTHLEASEVEDLVEGPADESEIYIEAGRVFSARHPWVVEQIKELAERSTGAGDNLKIHCSWLFGKDVMVVNAVDDEMPMHIVHIGDKRMAIVDDPSRETLSKLIDGQFAAMALATEGRPHPDHRFKERRPGREFNHIEEALVSLVDPEPTLFIDPDFQRS